MCVGVISFCGKRLLFIIALYTFFTGIKLRFNLLCFYTALSYTELYMLYRVTTILHFVKIILYNSYFVLYNFIKFNK
jgi:hypothetical protein